MINDRLIWFLESNNLIFGNRAGFRKDYSTNNHFVRLESFIRDAFIKKEIMSQYFLISENVLMMLTLLCMLMISVSFINRKIWRI